MKIVDFLNIELISLKQGLNLLDINSLEYLFYKGRMTEVELLLDLIRKGVVD